MGETDKGKQDSLPGTGQTSAPESGSTSAPAPRTYTEEERQKAISDALSLAGRQHKAVMDTVVVERDTLKGRVQAKEAELTEVTTKIADLNKQIDVLAANDPDKADLVKHIKALAQERESLKADREKLKAEQSQHQERIKLAADTMLEIDIWDIASEFEGGNAVTLKAMADSLDVRDPEKLRETAALLWAKKPAETATSTVVKPDSGVTSGGGGPLTYEMVAKMSPDERFKRRAEIAKLPLNF